MTIAQLLKDTRVDKDPTREIYTIDSEKSADIIAAIKSGDVLLGDGQIYILIEEGSKELVIGNSSDTYDSAFKVSGEGDGPSTVSWGNVTGKPSTFTPSAHTHTIAQVNGLQEELDSKADSTDIPDVSGFATNAELTSGLAGKANTSHTHTVAQVSNLQTVLDTKADKTQLDGKVDIEEGKSLSPEEFTTEEKAKLAGLEDVHYKGWFTSLASLEAAHPAPEEGSHALVDDPSGASVYIWKTDVEPPLWEARVGEGTEMTVAQVKTYYESNPDTNAFTDALKNKLEAFTANFTSALKTAYDNAASWISTNGASVLNHLSNKDNPHEVTASQLGLGNVSNTSDANKPVSIATQTALDNKVNFPSTNGHIPVRTSAGSQGSQPFTSTNTGNTVMFRDSNGRSHVAAPTENTHIANKAYADRVWTPDYSNMEMTNRITTHGGTWTVPSGRSGWVKLYTRTYTGGVLDAQVFLINGKVMENIWQEATSGSGTARSGSRSGLFPVKPGDVIQVNGNLERSCYFIPGVWA